MYKDPATKIYVDNIGSAQTELATLDAPIVGEVGDVINRAKPAPSTGITIFHSMGKSWRPEVPLFGFVLRLYYILLQAWPLRMPPSPRQFCRNI